MARVGDASASSVVTADVVALAAPRGLPAGWQARAGRSARQPASRRYASRSAGASSKLRTASMGFPASKSLSPYVPSPVHWHEPAAPSGAAAVTSNSGDRTPPRRRSITHCADRLHCLRPPQLIPPPESFDSPLDGHRFANSGEGRMAVRADLHSEIVLGGAGGNFVPASAAHERIHVWRMDSLLHVTPSSCECRRRRVNCVRP